MSMWQYIFDTDWCQRSDINRLERNSEALARKARSSTHKLEQRVEQLESEVAGLSLFNRTLLALLIERGGVDAEGFASKLRELDLEDGILDNR